MKVYEKLGIETLNGRIERYTQAVLLALKNFFECDALISEESYVEKENFIDN
jgi:hypothetical protein